jgi:cyclophilin family peptidyl-prolyl cis-trans isomerase
MLRIVLTGFTLLIFCTEYNSPQSKKVRISTNLGDMTFMYFTTIHPNTAMLFYELAREGYYDETLFYRVIQDFLIQGGSKSSKNAPPGKRIGYGDPDHTVDDEILPHHFHKKGALCAPSPARRSKPLATIRYFTILL